LSDRRPDANSGSNWPLLVFVSLIVTYVAIILRTSWKLTHAVRDYRPPDYKPSMRADKVRFRSRTGTGLIGWHIAPTEVNISVILCHGVWTNHYEMETRAQGLADRGFGVFVFDFSGSGESGGSTTSLGTRETQDLLGAIDFLETNSEESMFVVLGNSMGGAVGIMAAACDQRIKAVVADSAFATVEDNVPFAFRAITGLPAYPFQTPIVRVSEFIANAKISLLRPVDEIARISPRPVMLIQGSQDQIVDPRDAELLYQAANNPKALWRVENAGHVESFDLDPNAYLDKVDGFFREAVFE